MSIPYNAAMGSLQHLLDTLSPDPKTKGDEFELLARWYLTNEPEYASIVEKVWLCGMNGQDVGHRMPG
jgi:hypothetical protein